MILVLDDVSHGIVNCVFVTMQASTLWSVSRCPKLDRDLRGRTENMWCYVWRQCESAGFTSRPTTTASFTKTHNDVAERRKVSGTESRGQQRVCQHQAHGEGARCAGSERRVVLWCQSCTQRTTTAFALGSVKEQVEVPIVSVDLAALQAQAAISPRLLITRVEERSLHVTGVVARTPLCSSAVENRQHVWTEFDVKLLHSIFVFR